MGTLRMMERAVREREFERDCVRVRGCLRVIVRVWKCMIECAGVYVVVEGVYVREEGRNWRRCDGGHVRVRECVVETVSLDTHTHTQREREREREVFIILYRPLYSNIL